MAGLLNIPLDQLKLFLLVLTRVSIVLFMFPLLNTRMLPLAVKAGLALTLGLLLTPVVPVALDRFPDNIVQLVVMVVSELFLGMVMGLSIRLFFAAVQLAGQLIGFQMGFSIINVLDPQTGTQVSIIDQIGYWLVLLVFLVLNGHHVLIMALVESFHSVSFGGLNLTEPLMAQILQLSSAMFVQGIKIGAPAIVALLFTSAAFGLAARFAPQMNILIAAFPVKIVVGLFFFGFSLQIINILTRSFLSRYPSLLTTLLNWMGTG